MSQVQRTLDLTHVRLPRRARKLAANLCRQGRRHGTLESVRHDAIDIRVGAWLVRDPGRVSRPPPDHEVDAVTFGACEPYSQLKPGP